MKARTECENCGEEISLGEAQKPKTVDFISLICSECGHSQKKSLLRMYQRSVKKERKEVG